jgi:LysM repeat protein
VQRGDTLSQIARWCGTSVHHLASINGIWNPSRIYVGQVLRIW